MAASTVDLGLQFQAPFPEAVAWSAPASTLSANRVIPLPSGNTAAVTLSGSSLVWFDNSVRQIVESDMNLLYRDGVSNAGDIMIAFTGLAPGTYSLTLFSIDYTTAGSAGSPWESTFDVRVTDATRVALTTVLADQHTATRHSVASAQLPAVVFSPNALGAATIQLARQGGTGDVMVNGFILDDGFAVIDTAPPSATPPTWLTPPAIVQAGVAGVKMAAAALSDTSGIEYYFESIADPSRNSGWIASPSWVDLGLDPSSQHQYRFRARDLSDNQNQTPWSTIAGVTTAASNSFNGFSTAQIGTRQPDFDFDGARVAPLAPPVGEHPRVWTSNAERPELRNRLATTRSGQEVMATISAYNRLTDAASYGFGSSVEFDRNAPYALDAWGTPRINNHGYYFAPAPFYEALVTWNGTGNPLPFNTNGTYDASTRTRLASQMTMMAFEAWLYQGQAEYDARRQNVATALANWATLVVNDPLTNSSNEDIFGGVHSAITYDFVYDLLSPAQRDTVRTTIRKVTWTLSQNYGVDVAPYATTSNWTTLNYFAPLSMMAVEGEPGSTDAAAYINEYARVYYNFLTYGWYETGAPNEGLGKNYQMISAMDAFARRGHYLLGHENVRAYVTEYLPQTMQPFGNAFQEYDDWGGSGRVAATGGYKFAPEDAVGGKYLFPDEPAADFVLQNYMGVSGLANPYAAYTYSNPIGQKPFTPNSYNNSLIPAAIQAADFDAANLSAEAWEAANALANAGNLTFVEPDRGLVNTRSDFSQDAVSLFFSARQDLGGHTHADRNNFNLSADGRLWAIYRTESSSRGPSGNVLSESEFHNVILIDGEGMGVNSKVVAKQPAKVVSVIDTPAATFTAADAKYAYDWTWQTHTSGGISPGPDELPVLETLNDFRMTPSAEPWYDEPLYYRPWWNGDGLGENFTKTRFNPVLSAYRTAGLVRGDSPYTLIVDDYRKDNSVHNYKWLMQVPDDVVVESTVVDPNPAAFRNDVILAETGGNRRLLVRVIAADGLVNPSAPAAIENYLDPRYETSTWKRLVIEANAVAPGFKVMLFPFTVGETLPTTSIAPGSTPQAGGFTNSIGGQVDAVTYAMGADGRTRVSLTQNAAPAAIDAPDAAPSAPAALSAVAVSQTRAQLNWIDLSDNEERFVIERSTDGVNFAAVDSVLANVTSYLDLNLTAGVKYYYRVAAVNELASAPSNVASTTAWPGGAVRIQADGERYTQDFATLNSATVNGKNWSGDAWLPGWSLTRSTANTFGYDAGSSGTTRPYSVGPATTTTVNPNDRALGGIPTSNGNQAQGVLFVNSTGQTLSRVDIAYVVEHWRRNTNASSMKFYYKLQSTSPVFDLNSTAGWTTVSSLDFSAPTGSAASLDGNAPANRASRSTTLNITIPAGHYLYLGWRITGGGTSSNANLAIDDLAVTFVTNPTVSIPPVSPTPRTSPVESTPIVFSENITGFTMDDLVLSKDGGPNLLTGAQSLSTLDGKTFTLAGLADITAASGDYTLTLTAAGAGISDLSGNPLLLGAQVAWQTAADPITVEAFSHSPLGDVEQVTLVFSHDPGSSLAAGDLALYSGAQAVLADVELISYQPETRTAVFHLSGEGGSALVDGDYHIVMSAGSLSAGGSMMEANYVSPTFFRLAGDIDRDRSTGFDDLGVLLGQYGSTNAGWIDGDLNGDGRVDFDDLGILLGAYGGQLPAAAPLEAAFAAAVTAGAVDPAPAPTSGPPAEADLTSRAAPLSTASRPLYRPLVAIGPAQVVTSARAGFVGPIPDDSILHPYTDHQLARHDRAAALFSSSPTTDRVSSGIID